MKAAILRTFESLGGNRVARLITRGSLRILCYHGITEHDEADFSPVLFMRRTTFARRMEWLANSGYRVVSLQQGIEGLRERRVTPNTVVLTFDDGWAGIGVHAWPVLRRLGLPFTVYVSSYYMHTGQPVFNVAMRYLFWRAKVQGIDERKIEAAIAPHCGESQLVAGQSLESRVIAQGASLPTEQRRSLIREVCRAVDIDDEELLASRRFAFLTPNEVAEMANAGVDIQLHTHRHRFPADNRQASMIELADNRRMLQPLVRTPLEHFCYPSGEYDPCQFEWLAEAGMQSATTTAAGLATPDTHPMALPRLLDGERLPDEIFRAELSGAMTMARQLAGRTVRG